MTDQPIIIAESINVQRTAQLFVLTASRSAQPTELWLVLHGYGEAADAFLKQFEIACTPQRVFCAPEGLSKFYPKGTGGETGASWMTSRNRDSEIADYLLYLDDVAARMRRQYPSIESVNVLGFSQGASTASRWVATTSQTIDRLVLWGGSVAVDVNIDGLSRALNGTPVEVVVGNRDKYVTAERIATEQARLESANLPITLTKFEGGHRLDDTTLTRLLDRA